MASEPVGRNPCGFDKGLVGQNPLVPAHRGEVLPYILVAVALVVARESTVVLVREIVSKSHHKWWATHRRSQVGETNPTNSLFLVNIRTKVFQTGIYHQCSYSGI
ncbi:MAG: hypothetical protein NTW07_06840, partial [candidate division Zixibacteria bacterium]|nr:hypothetical protein [candidate division Zixibacteria bacterium]